MSAITHVFENLRNRGKGGLVAYVTAGDPNPDQTLAIAEALIQGGADILELGLPFSDPIADGPTIQAASMRALSAGTTPKTVLEMVQKIKSSHSLPVVIMTYYNPVFRMGLNRFFSLAKSCQVDGLIVPDLPIEEATDYCEIAKANGIDTIFLAAPSTSPERLHRIVSCSSGFLYLVSHFGVTGERDQIEDSTIRLIKHVVSYTTQKIPLAVGFGVSKPDQARSIINAGANAVVVGSAFVNVIQRNLGDLDRTLIELCALVRSMKNSI